MSLDVSGSLKLKQAQQYEVLSRLPASVLQDAAKQKRKRTCKQSLQVQAA